MSLNQYLEGLVKQAQTRETESRLSNLPVRELAKLAGVKLAQNACPKCGNGMTKVGKVEKCACGLVKRAQAETPRSGVREARLPSMSCLYRRPSKGIDAT